MKNPLFSCVIPVKGSRPYFNEAMESLRSQGLDDPASPQGYAATGELEIIIQDADVEPDCGQSDAFNKGFAKAKGEWIFWLNADDVLLPGALKAVRELIARKGDGISWIAGNVCYIDESDRVRRCLSERGWKRFYDGLPVRTYGPSSFFRRELLERCGPFDTSLHYCMDTDLWCKFRAAGLWYEKLPRYVWGFRVHEGSKTSGALKGVVPPRMQEEVRLVAERAGVNHWGLRNALIRTVRLLDGSTAKSVLDTIRFRERSWKGMAR